MLSLSKTLSISRNLIKLKQSLNYDQNSEIQYQLQLPKEKLKMGSCHCVNPQANKRTKRDTKQVPRQFQYNPQFQLQLQNKTSSASRTTKQSVSGNLFKTFEDWDRNISYQQARSAQEKWQNDRIVLQRYGEHRLLDSQQKQRKSSATTTDSYRKIETKNKIQG